MALTPIDGQPGLYRDTDSGQVVNIRDFQKFEHATAFSTWDTTAFKLRAGESWIVDQVSVLLHPWPEVIPTGLRFRLEINGYSVVDTTLRSAAEPLARDLNKGLLQRIEQLEEAAGWLNSNTEEREAAKEAANQALIQYGRPITSPAMPSVGGVPDFDSMHKLVRPQMLNQNHEVQGRLSGDADEMMIFRERIKTVELCLRGLRRPPVTRR